MRLTLHPWEVWSNTTKRYQQKQKLLVFPRSRNCMLAKLCVVNCICWVAPLPSNSHHQHYYMFRIGDPNLNILNLHLPRGSILGVGDHPRSWPFVSFSKALLRPYFWGLSHQGGCRLTVAVTEVTSVVANGPASLAGVLPGQRPLLHLVPSVRDISYGFLPWYLTLRYDRFCTLNLQLFIYI